jgi:hypothetical protein
LTTFFSVYNAYLLGLLFATHKHLLLKFQFSLRKTMAQIGLNQPAAAHCKQPFLALSSFFGGVGVVVVQCMIGKWEKN